MYDLPAASIEKNFFIFVEVVTLIFVPHMGEVVKNSKVRSKEGVKATPGQEVDDLRAVSFTPCTKVPLFYRDSSSTSLVCTPKHRSLDAISPPCE